MHSKELFQKLICCSILLVYGQGCKNFNPHKLHILSQFLKNLRSYVLYQYFDHKQTAESGTVIWAKIDWANFGLGNGFIHLIRR